MPRRSPPFVPAHDDHPTEKVVVAVDPYDVEDKASIFSVNYRNHGYVPVFFVITNDGDQPVSLVGMKAQLNTKDRSKLLPSTTDDWCVGSRILRGMTGRIRCPFRCREKRSKVEWTARRGTKSSKLSLALRRWNRTPQRGAFCFSISPTSRIRWPAPASI